MKRQRIMVDLIHNIDRGIRTAPSFRRYIQLLGRENHIKIEQVGGG